MSKWEKPIRHLGDGVNRAAIRSILKTRGETVNDFALIMGKTASCASNKLNGRAPFMTGDMDKLKRHWGLTAAEAGAIFFGLEEI